MKTFIARHGRVAAMLLFFAAATASGQEVELTLSGNAEVPPVNASGSGEGTVKVNADKTISGEIATKGVPGTMAHIHLGEAGSNGPVAIPLVKQGDDKWAVPQGTKLSDAHYEAFKAGKLYVNVHTAAHPGGEVRAQIKP